MSCSDGLEGMIHIKNPLRCPCSSNSEDYWMKLFFLVRAFLSTKLSKKPGDGGFMVNVPTTAMKSGWDGIIYFHKIVLKDLAQNYSDLKTGFAVGSGEIQIKDTKILH